VKKATALIFAFSLIFFYIFSSISQNLQVKRNDVAISVSDPYVRSASLSVAVVGDLHLSEGLDRLAALHKLLLEIKAAQPDLVVFVGDYTSSPSSVQDMPAHRENIINALKLLDPVPRAVVLGNYESWSSADKWFAEFDRLDVDAIENETRVINTREGPVCIRGFGDKYTKRYGYVDYSEECHNLPKFSITHDPAGAFDSRVKGLVIAGHTHCGQVSLPFFGALWVPSDAPSSSHCGLYKDKQRQVFVTSGVGTSIFPVRFGAQSQWDFVELKFTQ
jgi:predicted MPP superfamily phosphohydrolase